jgi:hypothetical protein
VAINDGDSGASDGSSDLGIFEEDPDADYLDDLEEDDDMLREQYLDLIDELDDEEIDERWVGLA